MSTSLRAVLVRAALLLAALAGLAAAPALATAALPAHCTHEKRTIFGTVDPRGLCVSLGSATKNVLTSAEGKVPMPFDYYVRSDVADGFVAGKRPRGTYLLLYGGAFVCGSRADLAWQARRLADRGYVAIVPEYPLAGALSAYGYYKPVPGYRQDSPTTPKANVCDVPAWKGTAGWKGFVTALRTRGFEPVLQQGQWVLQTLIRKLKTDPSYGVDPKKIFAVGSSAGGSLAIRLALGGDDDRTPSGVDQGDSTIAGALSISGPACYPGSVQVTAPLLLGEVLPSQMPPCKMALSAADPQLVMIQEPRGGIDDPVVPSALMLGGCTAMNTPAFGTKCIYEDRLPAQGGYIPDGEHAALTQASWLRLFDVLAANGVGPA